MSYQADEEADRRREVRGGRTSGIHGIAAYLPAQVGSSAGSRARVLLRVVLSLKIERMVRGARMWHDRAGGFSPWGFILVASHRTSLRNPRKGRSSSTS